MSEVRIPPDEQPDPPEPPAAEPPKKPRSRRKVGSGEGANLEQRLREPLLRIGEWLQGRDPEFATALKEDGPKIARLLAKWVASGKAPVGFVVIVQLLASALEPIDAFARIVRLTAVRVFAWRASRRPPFDAGAQELPDELPPDWPIGEQQPAEPEPEPPADPFDVDNTPERFRVGTEPPPVD